MSKIHQCKNAYSKGREFRVTGGDILLEDDNGNLFRLINGSLTPVPLEAFNAGSFQTTEWETASASPGKKRSVKRKSDDG